MPPIRTSAGELDGALLLSAKECTPSLITPDSVLYIVWSASTYLFHGWPLPDLHKAHSMQNIC